MISNKTVGIPKALMYFNYHTFAESFFQNLGFHVVVSPDTNKQILNEGVKCCVDDACLPIKDFHGHISWLKDKCDYLLLPHFLSLAKGQKLCPMFCGLVEMVQSSISGLPPLIDTPVLSLDQKKMREWALQTGRIVSLNKKETMPAFHIALRKQKARPRGLLDNTHQYRIALIGHSYIVCDAFINMHIVDKLHSLGIGTVTSEHVSREDMINESCGLFKQPFWYFAREYYGSAVSLCRRGAIDGIIYLSTFSCGVDSVFTELVKQEIGSVPFMVLKLDEHTGEAALDTRIEAFTDMLKRRMQHDDYISAHGQHLPGRQVVL